MKFGEKPISKCIGDLLVHSVKLPDGKLPKGTSLSKAHIQKLRSVGITSILVASLEEGDVDENLAAKLLSNAFKKIGFQLSAPATGRVNFIAEKLSIARLDVEKIKRLNEIDEAITFATVLPDQLLVKGQMLATLKIIPYAVSQNSIDEALNLIASSVLLSCQNLISLNFSLIQTKFEDTKSSILIATENVTRARLAQLDCSLVDCQIVDHTSMNVSKAMIRAREQGAQAFLLCGASAIADRLDVLPEALRLVGGEIIHIGLPVDPGNLSMVGEWDGMVVLGMPGCARSSKLNGLDWLLQKTLAGVKLDKSELSGMAVGGLLADIASRPLPRKLIHKNSSTENKIAGIILAAGSSTRMGVENKLLLPLNNGMTMISWIVKTFLNSKIDNLFVVTGFQEKEVRRALTGLNVKFIHNPSYETGQASSVTVAIENLPEQYDSALIGLADMPFVTAELIDRLIESHNLLPKPETRITLPLINGERSNPVIWGKAFFDELQNISGDQGGRQILSAYLSAINGVSWEKMQIAEDIDIPEDRNKLSSIY